MERKFLTNQNGAKICLHIFEPEIKSKKLLLINSATGVRQQIYFSFAENARRNGFTVITYDYEGIGLSKPVNLKKSKASMRSWGNSDFKLITDFIIKNFPDDEKFCLGHSVGALILGMNNDSQIFKKLIFVATQNAYVGNLKFKTKAEAFLGFGIAQPLSTWLLGYFPGNWFGLGESLTKNCAYDWRTLILNRKSTSKLLEKTDDFSKKLSQKTLVLYAEDDAWLTEKGVKSLLENTYINLKPEYRILKASESEKGEIGHINFFRSFNEKLWRIIIEYLNKNE
ncbi:serine aminopeptidase domain-containing protein [Chryseobacterium sp.]|uniref:alpha/beta hydrolase family protein n=1 Tax=Chryseobacterium sp. TaxID=1871047 RepID=UPI00289BBECF|nr:alpha/beta hydrolase [Chryseobacterium sp.]